MKRVDPEKGPKVPVNACDESTREDSPGDYDEQLGRSMARDARRVSNGDLSEEEFYEKYHEAVVEEFGRDERPIESGSGT